MHSTLIGDDMGLTHHHMFDVVGNLNVTARSRLDDDQELLQTREAVDEAGDLTGTAPVARADVAAGAWLETRNGYSAREGCLCHLLDVLTAAALECPADRIFERVAVAPKLDGRAPDVLQLTAEGPFLETRRKGLDDVPQAVRVRPSKRKTTMSVAASMVGLAPAAPMVILLASTKESSTTLLNA